jgi:hypothetical protein
MGKQFHTTTNGTRYPGVPNSFTRWNAAINFTMLKDEKGVLRISVFDILNSGKSINNFAKQEHDHYQPPQMCSHNIPDGNLHLQYPRDRWCEEESGRGEAVFVLISN